MLFLFLMAAAVAVNGLILKSNTLSHSINAVPMIPLFIFNDYRISFGIKSSIRVIFEIIIAFACPRLDRQFSGHHVELFKYYYYD